jgi:predicted double-glycine peptidase
MQDLKGLAVIGLLFPLLGLAEPVRSMLEFRQDKIVLQQFDLSCGAAALATILAYQHGESLTERDVAIGLVTREVYLQDPNTLRIRQGFSLFDMDRYVEERGYEGEAFGSLTYDDLLSLAPAIVPVRVHGYNHFVVFRGALGRNVLLGDPAFGNRTMSRQRFVTAWIDYAELGRVAFVVRRRDGLIPPNQLAPTSADFSLLD